MVKLLSSSRENSSSARCIGLADVVVVVVAAVADAGDDGVGVGDALSRQVDDDFVRCSVDRHGSERQRRRRFYILTSVKTFKRIEGASSTKTFQIR